jgi:hypothetical protein
MSAFVAGDTFLIGPDSDSLHLHITLCDPAGDPPTILVVSLNTVTPHTDRTLILHKGDHPFVQHDTAVSYDQMRSMPLTLLAQLEKMNDGRGMQYRTFRRHQPVSGDLLQRVVEAALASKMTPKDLVKELKERLNLAG